MLIYSQEEFEELVFRSHRAGLQLAVHAIGDRAIDIALETFEKVLKENSESWWSSQGRACFPLKREAYSKNEELRRYSLCSTPLHSFRFLGWG